jgi:hypothetical protein
MTRFPLVVFVNARGEERNFYAAISTNGEGKAHPVGPDDPDDPDDDPDDGHDDPDDPDDDHCTGPFDC